MTIRQSVLPQNIDILKILHTEKAGRADSAGERVQGAHQLFKRTSFCHLNYFALKLFDLG